MNRALLISPFGFIIGLSIGALGSGGSILAVPALVHLAGESPQQATTTSLLLVGIATLTALPAHYRSGRVRPWTGIAFGVLGTGGSLAGTAANRHLDPNLLLLAFAALILVAAWRMLTACPTCTRSGEAAAMNEAGAGSARDARFKTRDVALLAGAGTGVGFLTGLFGVGGGFVVVPVLTLFFGFAMPQAIGTSLLIVAINSATALAARVGSVSIDWPVAGAFLAATLLGVRAGVSLAHSFDAERTLRLFAGGLVLLAVFTAVSALRAMA